MFQALVLILLSGFGFGSFGSRHLLAFSGLFYGAGSGGFSWPVVWCTGGFSDRRSAAASRVCFSGVWLLSQLAPSSRVSSPVSPDSASGASSLAGSLSKLGEVSALMGPTFTSLAPPLFSLAMLSQGLGLLAPALDVVHDSFSQQASSGQVKVPQPRKIGYGSAFPSVSSGAVELGERLRLSLPMMSESGAPIYPSKSKSTMRYSRKRKDE
jgi:hypothetical protein